MLRSTPTKNVVHRLLSHSVILVVFIFVFWGTHFVAEFFFPSVPKILELVLVISIASLASMVVLYFVEGVFEAAMETNYRIRRGFERAIESEDGAMYKKLLMLNAFNKAEVGDDDEKRLATEQLQQYYLENGYRYMELFNVLESGLAGAYEKLIAKILDKIRKLNWLQIVKKEFYNRRLKKAIEKEEYNIYLKRLIDNALIKIKSSSEGERKLGFEQLSQFGEEYAYEKLLGILKNDGIERLFIIFW